MFEHLDDAQPPDPGARYDAVLARARSRRLRRRLVVSGGAAGVAAALVAAFVLVPSHSGTSKLVTGSSVKAADSARDQLPHPSRPPAPSLSPSAAAKSSPAAQSVALPAYEGSPTDEPTSPSATPSPTPAPTCSSTSSDGQPDALAPTRTEFKTEVTHAWMLCSHESVFGSFEEGLELRSDGQWFKLLRLSNGSYGRMTGYANEGTWSASGEPITLLDGTTHWEVSLHGDGMARGVATTTFWADGARGRYDNGGSAHTGEYVALPDGSVSGDAPPSEPATCTARTSGDAPKPTTQAEFESRVIGTWQICEKPSVFGSNEDGMEIRPDHTYVFLSRDADGEYHRMTGYGSGGTWASYNNSDDQMNAGNPPDWEFNFSGCTCYFITFFANLPRFELDSEGVYIADYVPLDPGRVGD